MKTFINGISDLKIFVKERDEALLSLDKDKILEFYNKYGIPYSNDEKSFWTTVYKCIYNLDSATRRQKNKAISWLARNGINY